MNEEFVAVLDLGSTKATCLVASPDEKDGIKIEAIASTPCHAMKKGVLTDGVEAVRALGLVIDRAERDANRKLDSFVVGFGGTQFNCLTGQGLKHVVPKGRLLTNQDVLEVINHSQSLVFPQGQVQMQALPREFRVDGERNVQKPVGMSGSKLEVFTCIISASSEALKTYADTLDTLGRRAEQFVLSPLASGIGVLTEQEMNQGAMLVDIGGGTTDVAVFNNGSLAYSAVIPAGSSYVTSDVSQLLKTSLEEAERLKTTYGSASAALVPDTESVEVLQNGQTHLRPMQRKVLCEIIEARMREIAKLVLHHAEKSGFYASLPGGIVLTGGGAQMSNTDKLFADHLKHLRVRIAEPDLPRKFGKQVGCSTAVGLARFAIQCKEELGPANGSPAWKSKVQSLFSIISGR